MTFDFFKAKCSLNIVVLNGEKYVKYNDLIIALYQANYKRLAKAIEKGMKSMESDSGD